MYKVGDVVDLGKDKGIILHVNQINSQPLILEFDGNVTRWWSWKEIGEVIGHIDISKAIKDRFIEGIYEGGCDNQEWVNKITHQELEKLKKFN